jgi:hypothetical protein
VAATAALFWSILFFGLTDLLVVLLQDQRFSAHYVVETSWGLLYTALVAWPLIMFAVRPRWWIFLHIAGASGGAVLIVGLLGRIPGQAVAGAFVVLSAAAPLVMSMRTLWPATRPRLRACPPTLLVLATLAAVGSIGHAVMVVTAIRSNAVDDNTWELMHLPMQAAFGFAVPAAAFVAVVARTVAVGGARVSALPSSVSAIWFGSVSLLYPDLVGSLGAFPCMVCIAWGLAFAVAALLGRTSPAR